MFSEENSDSQKMFSKVRPGGDFIKLWKFLDQSRMSSLVIFGLFLKKSSSFCWSELKVKVGELVAKDWSRELPVAVPFVSVNFPFCSGSK